MTLSLEKADGSRNFLRATRSVASLNMFSVAASSVAGFLLASVMSSTTRGAYAGIQSWFWISQVLGQLGLAASLTYHVARYPRDWKNYLGVTQRTLAVGGIVVCALGVALSPTLGRGSPSVAASYACVFLAVPATMIFGTYVFVLQAQSLKLWNRARLVQPCLYLAFVLLAVSFHRNQLIVAVAVLIVSSGLQGVLARRLVLRLDAPSAGGSESGANREIRARLLRYGFANLLGAGPELVNTRLDQLVLSVVSPLASLGQYAIAVSISNLALPAVLSLGQVALPQLAAAEGKTTKHIVFATMIVAPVLAGVVGVGGMVGLSGGCPFVSRARVRGRTSPRAPATARNRGFGLGISPGRRSSRPRASSPCWHCPSGWRRSHHCGAHRACAAVQCRRRCGCVIHRLLLRLGTGISHALQNRLLSSPFCSQGRWVSMRRKSR